MSGQANHEPEKYLVQHVRDALAGDPRIGELHVDVSIRGDKVFLTGSVPSIERRDAIAELVKDVLPTHEVHNHVTVDPIAGSATTESLG